LRIRPVALALCAGFVASVTPAHAAGPKPQILDKTGDANGINGQGLGLGEPPDETTGPADLSGADITSVLFATNFVTKKVRGKKTRVPNGFSVTLSLAAAPTTDIEYRVIGSVAGCDGLFFEYNTAPVTGESDVRCPGTTPLSDTDYYLTGSISGQKIVWVVPDGRFRNGTVFSSLAAETRAVAGKLTVPEIDYASSPATYTVGK
jgi:hypothetical protein